MRLHILLNALESLRHGDGQRPLFLVVLKRGILERFLTPAPTGPMPDSEEALDKAFYY